MLDKRVGFNLEDIKNFNKQDLGEGKVYIGNDVMDTAFLVQKFNVSKANGFKIFKTLS